MELKYHVGDKVMIRPDLKMDEVYRMYSGPMNGRHTYSIAPSMTQLVGNLPRLKVFVMGELDIDLKNMASHGPMECCCRLI